jgi:thymidylate kinase
VAIEGIDGCGKTTQARMLVDRLKMNGYETTCVRPVYVLLNLMRLRVRDKNSVSPRKTRVYETPNKNPAIIQRAFMGLLGYLYALATYIFLKVYCRNKIVVCDRYFYQFFFDLFGNWNGNVIKFFPKPDTTFFLDGDLDLFYSRMDNSFDASVSRDYYSEVLNLYKKISQKYGFIQIDAKLNKEAINGVILTHLTKRIGEVL